MSLSAQDLSPCDDFVLSCPSGAWQTTSTGLQGSVDAKTNHCTASNAGCKSVLKASLTGIEISGIVTTKSGVFGCQLNSDPISWFQLDPAKSGTTVYLCYLAGLDASKQYTITLINGNNPSTELAYIGYYSVSLTPSGASGDGKTWLSQGLPVTGAKGNVTSSTSSSSHSSTPSSSTSETSSSSAMTVAVGSTLALGSTPVFLSPSASTPASKGSVPASLTTSATAKAQSTSSLGTGVSSNWSSNTGLIIAAFALLLFIGIVVGAIVFKSKDNHGDGKKSDSDAERGQYYQVKVADADN